MRAFLLVAVPVLLVAAWLVLARTDAPAPAAALPPADKSAVAPEAPIAAATAPLPVDGAAGERTRAAVGEAPAPPPVPDDVTWIDVLVVDRASGAPVPGADAWWSSGYHWPEARALPPRERDALSREPELMVRRFGWHGRSDRDGRLRVHVQQQAQIHARADGRYGTVTVRLASLPQDGVRLELAADHTLRVRVHDAHDRPAADVPVLLRDVIGGEVSPFASGAVPTTVDGIATFLHVQRRQTAVMGPRRGQPVERWSVAVGIAGLDVAPVLVDAQAPPHEPVEVQLPPAGRLTVKLTFDGRPPRGIERVMLSTGARDDPGRRRYGYAADLDAEGCARFAHVPLGTSLWVGPGSWEHEVRGPTLPDQEATVHLELAGEILAVGGRLLDAEGAPLAEQDVHGECRELLLANAIVRTDGAGRFLWLLGRAPRGQPDGAPTSATLAFHRSPETGPRQRVAVPPRLLVPGHNELGDLRLEPEPLVVAGRFVFDSPGPARVAFAVQRERQRPGGEGARSWEHVPLTLTCSEDGAFEARGTVEPGRYRLLPRRGGPVAHLPVDPVEFAPGARGVEIAVRRGAGLEASCILPAGIGARLLRTRLVAPAADPQAALADTAPNFFNPAEDPLRGQIADVGAERVRLSWSAVAAGSYTLRVEVPGLLEPLVAVPGVLVPPPAGGDARLDALDLRDGIAPLRVRVRLPANEPAQGTLVFLLPQPQHLAWRALSVVEANEIVVPAPPRPVDLLVARRGLRPVTLRGVHGEAEVALEPWPVAELHFPGATALPAGASLHVEARATAPSPDARYVDAGGGSLADLLRPAGGMRPVENGVARLALGDGPQQLAVALRVAGCAGARELQQVEPAQLVAAGLLTVQISVEEVVAAAAELRTRSTK